MATTKILWLLALGDSLPAAAIPDVVDLYIGWSMCTLGLDPLTPLLVGWLHRWLMEIQGTRHPFDSQLPHDQISRLAGDLRMGFLTFCNRAPDPQKVPSFGGKTRTEESYKFGFIHFP